MSRPLTDNVSLATKVALRRWLLDRMKLRAVRVLDTCTGEGHVWRAMQEHCRLETWTRCDVKPRQSGVLKLEMLDAVRTLPVASFNVIDIDPYGEPFGPFLELLKRYAGQVGAQPIAVFLTHGHIDRFKHISHATLAAAGIPATWVPNLPRTPHLTAFLANRMLGQALDYARVEHAAMSTPSGQVTYYALGLAPIAKGKRRG